MFDLARIGPGSYVLDIAAGDGDHSLAAAVRVGPNGFVLATDIAEQLLEFARVAARHARVKNFAVSIMDGENLGAENATFDAVTCRFGLAFFPDSDRALGEMYRVLKPGGRVSLVTYAATGSPVYSLAHSIIQRRTGQPVPDSDQSGGDSVGMPGVLEKKLSARGFQEVETRSLLLPLRFSSAAECARYLRDASPTLAAMLSSISTQARQEAWQEVEEALAAFEGPEGFESPDKVLVAAGSVA